MRLRDAFSLIVPLRGKRLLAAATVAALAGACAASPPKFDNQTYTTTASSRIYEEALDHLQANYIQRVDLRDVSVAGINGLSEIDPEITAVAGPARSYALKAGTVETARFEAPIDDDADSWARTLASAVDAARTRSKLLRDAKPDDVYSAVLNGVTESLDQFSRYEPPRRASESRARREGYGGIGVTIRDIDDKTVIQEVMPNTPANAAGLLRGDVITHADGTALQTLAREDRAERLRGPIGTPVDVSIQREDIAPFTVQVERDEIVPTTVYFQNDKLLPRFRISAFSRNTAESLADEIAKAERKFGPLPGIVLDLRGNPGGYLTQAIEVADLFLEDGIVVETHGRHPSSSSNYLAHPGALGADKPIIVLIDGRSASASELLAAALVDAGRAAAVGSVTYGKGSIQNLEELANGGELIITWSRMHAPSGYLLDGLGVRPTVCTSNGAGTTAATMITAARRNGALEAASWRTYKAPDADLADSLRAACPAHDFGDDVDLDVARSLLENRQAYKAALSPLDPRPTHAAAKRWRPRNG